MKVLFLEHVINVWKKWEIKEVKSWFASNMLFPKKLAIELTPEQEKKHKMEIGREDKHRRELIENRHNLSDILNGKKISFSVKTWPNGKVFGGIWEKDIIEAVKKNFKIELSKKHISLLDGHIKKLWEHQVFIKLGKDSMAKMTILFNKES